MLNTFIKKDIQIGFKLGSGTFSNGRSEKSVQGLMVTASIEKSGLPSLGRTNISIYNMDLNDMEKLTTLSYRAFWYRRNKVTVFAGEDGQLSKVFAGEILSATANFNESPDPVFQIEAMTGFFGSVMPTSPISVVGVAPTQDIMSQLASQMGYSFKNEGDTGSLRNAVLNGSPMDQAQAAAQQVGAQLVLDDDEMTLLPKGQAFNGKTVRISKDTGMIGYPVFNNNGITVKSRFNPNVAFNGVLEIDTVVPKASGRWRILKVIHNISAYGVAATDWMTQIECLYPWGF